MQLVFDSPRWSDHPSTTAEVRACCQDVKVLGRKELRMLLAWRKALRVSYYQRELMTFHKTYLILFTEINIFNHFCIFAFALLMYGLFVGLFL